MTARSQDILVVGAGPVGLTAALELARRGFAPRIIDAAGGPAAESRALAVNPRTLEILEPSGATEEMLARGLKIRRMTFWDPPKRIFSIPIGQLRHRFNFILSLPQYDTERVLIERLASYGFAPEWETALTSVTQTGGRCETVITHKGASQEAAYDIVIGADGAHSTVRKAVEIGFQGSRYEHDFGLADVDLQGPGAQDELNLYRVESGICGLIPIGGGRFRIVADQPDALDALPEDFSVKTVHWRTRFRISHRQVETYQKGSVFLAGDAAHIHSPVGGRGMNLGIEDAGWLAWLIETGNTEHYTERRLPVGRHVLKQTELQTRIMTSRNPLARLFRRNVIPAILASKFARHRQLLEMAGLAAPAPPWLEER